MLRPLRKAAEKMMVVKAPLSKKRTSTPPLKINHFYDFFWPVYEGFFGAATFIIFFGSFTRGFLVIRITAENYATTVIISKIKL